MAYALQFDGVNDYVSIPQISCSDGFSLEFIFEYLGDTSMVLGAGGNNSFWIGTLGSDGWATRFGGSNKGTLVTYTPAMNEIVSLKLSRENGSSTVTLDINGNTGTFLSSSTLLLELFCKNQFGYFANVNLRSVAVENKSTTTNYFYDPSATNGVGTTLEDTGAASNDGTLFGGTWVVSQVFSTDFTRLGSLTAPAVTGSASDLPTLVKYEDFTATMLASLDTGGGDLRFSSDEAGTTQLACEVVTFTKAAGDVVWVKVPAVSTGALIYVWGDNTGATQPAVDAAFGRNAVWSAFSFYSHDGGVTESTASLAMIDDGSGAVGTGQPSGADDLTAPKQRLSDASIGDTVGNYTLTSWHNGNSAGTFISRRDGSINQYQTGLTGSGSIFEYFYQDSSGTFTQFAGSALSGWHKADYVITGTSCELFIDGVSRNTIVISKGSQPAVPLRLGFRGNGGLGTGGFAYANRIGESSVCSSAKSSTQIDIEYDNQSATGAWWTAADEGGGGPVTQILTPTAIASEENFGTPSLATGLVTVTAIGIASEEAVGSVSLSTGATLLTPEDIVSQEVLGDPNLLVGATALTTESITTEEALGLISLLSQSVVLVSSITSEEIVGNPELAYEQTISVVSAHTGETMGRTTVLGGVVVISLNTVYRDVMSDVYRTTMRDGYDIRT